MQLWEINDGCQRICSDFLGEIKNKYPKSKQIQFIKRTAWVLPHTVRREPISRVFTLYSEANRLGKSGYKAGNISKVVQIPHDSVQKSELCAGLMILLDFNESLKMTTDSQ